MHVDCHRVCIFLLRHKYLNLVFDRCSKPLIPYVYLLLDQDMGWLWLFMASSSCLQVPYRPLIVSL